MAFPSPVSFAPAQHDLTVFLTDGDSMTQGIGASAASALHTLLSAEPNFSGKGRFVTIGLGGRPVSQIVDEFYNSAPYLPPRNFGYLLIWGGAAATGATTLADLQEYWSQARAAGWKVVAFTILPQADDSAADVTLKATINAGIRAASSEWDYMVDVAALPEFADPSNPLYFSDVIHLTALGYQTVADYINQTLDLPVL